MRRASWILAGSIALALGCAHFAPSDERSQNRILVLDYIQEYINEHDIDAPAGFRTGDYIHHSEDPDAAAGGGMDRSMGAMFEAIPDLRADVIHIVAEGDKVAALLRWTGTVERPIRGLGEGVVGRKIDLWTADIWRIQRGRIAEHWDVLDNHRMLTQLGLIGDSD